MQLCVFCIFPGFQNEPDKFFYFLLIKSPPLGREHDQATCVRLTSFLRDVLSSFLDAFDYRFDHQHHARSAAVGSIVDAVVAALGPVANVVQLHIDQVAVDRSF